MLKSIFFPKEKEVEENQEDIPFFQRTFFFEFGSQHQVGELTAALNSGSRGSKTLFWALWAHALTHAQTPPRWPPQTHTHHFKNKNKSLE